MSQIFVLGVDVGTGSTKAVLCDPQGKILEKATHRNHMKLPRPGYAEMDAEGDWWGSVIDVCEQITSSKTFAAVTQGKAHLGGICVSGLGPAVVVTDGEGNPGHPAILYGIDTRAGKEIIEQTEALGEKEILARCGKALSSQAIGPKLSWIRSHVPGVAADAPWYSTHSYVVKKLTDNWVLDHHTASQCDPLYDVMKQEWATDWIDTVLPGLRVPKLLWPGELAGSVTPQAAALTGLPEGTPVLAGTVDAWAEAYSAGVSAPGDLMLMYGSTMFMVQVLSAPTVGQKLWTTSGVAQGSHTLAAGMSTSGSITNWIQELCGGAPFETLVKEASEISPGSDGLVLLPYFAGERTPLYDPNARGTIAGLTLRHSRGHVFRAVYEGIAYGIRQIIEELEFCAGRAARVIAVGGGTQGDLWTQIVSDACGITQIIPEVTIGAAYGDALLVAQYCGAFPQDQSWLKAASTVTPRPANAAVYQELYSIYREMYPATASLMHRLAAVQEMSGQ
ncbi:MAG: FGGY family carbohydrate kinase [Actinomycetaceae bacterium]|nr:FGGY family carbohydrate kinase [Actinomycetaceae bacterium]